MSVDDLSVNQLVNERQIRYRQRDNLYIKTENDALDFINELGFAWLINLSDADLPSLEKANPGPYLYDDYQDNTRYSTWWWAWKQTLPGRKACYYAKVLRGRGTFISWECFPLFYAVYASGNDYHEDYRLGVLSRDEKRALDIISEYPEISSRDLRKKYAPPGKDSTRSLNRAIQSLQETFRITVAGGLLDGWTLHNWALVDNWVPNVVLTKAQGIDRSTAMKALILKYLYISCAAALGDIAWVFRWKLQVVSELLVDLINDGAIRKVSVSGIDGFMYMLA
jgi:hypothetical protein